MKRYQAGAVLLAVTCLVSTLPVTALAKGVQTEKSQKSAENSENKEEKETTQNKKNDKSKRGTIKNSGNKEQTDQLSSTKKAEEKELVHKETADKNKQKDKSQETADLTNEKAEKQIPITSVEDFQKIGTEGYPLDGEYILQNDLDGRDIQKDENTIIEPLLKTEEPFTGVINGGEHAIANYNIQWLEEGEKNISVFGTFHGKLQNIKLLNIQVISEKNSAAMLAENIEGAELQNIILAGKAVLSDSEQLSEEEKEQRKTASVALQADGENWNDFLKSKNQKTKFTNVKVVTNLSDMTENYPEGLSKIETNPEYVSTVEGKEETIQTPELEGFTFVNWTVEGWENNEEKFAGEVSSPEKMKTKITGKEGKYRLNAAYEYELNIADEQAQAEENTSASETKHTAPLILEVPYIVGKDIKNIEKLIPIDNVFPKQITAVMYLEAIDGVFPKKLEVGKKTEKEKIAITSWEQFKNIGNTDYNPHFVMDANYVLEADIFSDGEAFTPIGTEENPFTGSFDGNGFSIDVSQNPEIDESKDYYGLFGVVQPKSEKK